MSNDTEFKKVFKYYKRKKPPPDLSNVISGGDSEFFTELTIKDHLISNTNSRYKNVKDWKVRRSRLHPGLILVQNVFSPADQLYWSHQCLSYFSSAQFKRNIDHPDLKIQTADWFRDARDDSKLVDKLRWSTLGYHHDWDTKVYSEANKGVFPTELGDLSVHIISTVLGIEFRAEAAIVNFYPRSATLSGHTDHSEHCLSHPLLSISLGQPAIFLVGGESLSTTPYPYLLSTGDVLIMTKETRLCYHGVPRILEDDSLHFDGDVDVSNVDREFCLQYLKDHRININVRQVH